MNTPQTATRDPVCGMSVNPATAKYSHVHEGATWYFCADNCRQQFMADPDRFIKTGHDEPRPTARRKVPWTREILMWAAMFVAVIVIVMAARGFSNKLFGVAPGSAITGTSAGAHEAIDGGQGGVIAEAKHEQKSGDLEFVLSLDTHTVDLTKFDPVQQVQLRADGQTYAPQTVTETGERSSHHQNYRLTFPPVGEKALILTVDNVGGVVERALPFKL